MSFARTLVVLVLLGIVGVVGYQIGIGQNIAAQLPAVGAPGPYYGYPYGPGFGFGFLGFLFPLFFFFLIFGLLRAAMWGGRGWSGHKHGYGSMRGPWGDEARSRIEELHKELHGEKPASGGPSSTST
jgi:hypothetical protein